MLYKAFLHGGRESSVYRTVVVRGMVLVLFHISNAGIFLFESGN